MLPPARFLAQVRFDSTYRHRSRHASGRGRFSMREFFLDPFERLPVYFHVRARHLVLRREFRGTGLGVLDFTVKNMVADCSLNSFPVSRPRRRLP